MTVFDIARHAIDELRYDLLCVTRRNERVRSTGPVRGEVPQNPQLPRGIRPARSGVHGVQQSERQRVDGEYAEVAEVGEDPGFVQVQPFGGGPYHAVVDQ